LPSLLYDTPTIDIYPLSLHDALPICPRRRRGPGRNDRISLASRTELFALPPPALAGDFIINQQQEVPVPSCNASTSIWPSAPTTDRKSTRLNSSHVKISYAVFCLKKK